MLFISLNQRRWLVSFGCTLGILIGLAVLSSWRLADYRDQPFDFYAMRPGELLVVNGLTRRQGGSIKLGFAEAYEPPEIGLYGNHVFQFFGSEAFGDDHNKAYFFNYWYANLALPEIYRYLRRVEQLGHLPKKLILVQITSPNLDNGQFIANFGYELPADLLLFATGGDSFAERSRGYVAFAWQATVNRLHEVLNYGPFVFGFLQKGYQDRVIDPANCQMVDFPSWLPDSLRWVPHIQEAFGRSAGNLYCELRLREGAFRRDGSCDSKYASAQLIQNEDALVDRERGLKAGDEYEVARQMRAIEAIGRHHNINVAFVVPPAYESNRSESVVNQIFNRGLALVPDLTVIDHRHMNSDASLFVDYHHHSSRYFHILADELRQRGLIE